MRKAFTLLEVLVVTSVFAMLAGLVLPVTVRARETARRTQCLGNLKQVSIGVGLYLNDWEDCYPWAYSSLHVQEGYRPALPETLREYVSDPRIWICPSDTGEIYPAGGVGYGEPTPPFWKYTMSSYHWPGIGLRGNEVQLAGMPSQRVRLPSKSVLSWEGRPWHDRNAVHRGIRSPAKFNVLYCDGHVAARPAKAWISDQFEAF